MPFLAGERLTAARLNIYVTPPMVWASQIATQSIPNTTWTAITMTGEVVDTIGGHSTITATSRYTPTIAGYYDVEGLAVFAANTTGDRGAQIRKNGTTLASAPYGAQPSLKGATFAHMARCTGLVYLNGTTDYVELWGYQDSGGALSTDYNAALVGSYLRARRSTD